MSEPGGFSVITFNCLLIVFFRTLSAMTGWVRCLLATEQKKTDFRPEEKEEMLMYSPVCKEIKWDVVRVFDAVEVFDVVGYLM